MNMQLFGQKDARIRGLDFMFRAWFVDTYSEFQAMRRLGFDWYHFRGFPARDQCPAFALNRALMLFFISHFFTLFPNFVWPFLQCFVHVLDVCGLYKYYRMN